MQALITFSSYNIMEKKERELTLHESLNCFKAIAVMYLLASMDNWFTLILALVVGVGTIYYQIGCINDVKEQPHGADAQN